METETDFDLHQNVSYLDPNLPRATLRQALRHYVASALIYGGVLLLFRISPWYRELLSIPFLGRPVLALYGYAYVAYLLIAPLVTMIARPRSLWVSKNVRIADYLGRLARWCMAIPRHRDVNAWRPTYDEKHALMFLLIKVYYGPLMVNGALLGYHAIPSLIKQIQMNPSLLNTFDKGYVLFVTAIFLVDSTLYGMGYHSESGLLRNRLRYAETNPLHVLVCVACYPPFNLATGAFLGPSNRDPYILFGGSLTHPLTWLLRGLSVLLLILLISSSLSLLTRASNLTNRGIVDWGPYRFVRHPGYIAKNLFWLTTLIPALVPNTGDPRFTWSGHLLFCAMIVWGAIGWGTLYFLRALTEERFLSRDPDYVAYCQKVKYRFIPGVY